MRKLALFFILSFAAFYVVIHISFKMLSEDYYASVDYETELMHESVKERFDLYLNSSHIIGFITANIFSNKQVNEDSYDRLGRKVTEKFHEILGFNLLDNSGKIIRVFPYQQNQNALNKITQNFNEIQNSVSKGNSYWFSPPFELYQGEVGFAFYVPIFDQGKLTGWIAPLLSNRLFFERFKPSKFLSKYHLVVRDKETGRDYLSTADLPDTEYVRHDSQIFGRPVAFYSWPIHPGFDFKLPWYLCFLMAFVFSILTTLSYRLVGQKRETNVQLRKIKALINFTAKEASSSLMGIYKELNLMGKETGYVSTDKVSKYISYISNLLDQISVSEKISHPSQMLEFQNAQIYPLLREQLDLYSDRLRDKGLKVKIDDSPLMHDFQVWSNKWLLCHSVFGNILRNLVYYASPGSDINVTFFQDDKNKLISFYHLEDETPGRDVLHDEILDRCLSIAKEVVKVSNGCIDVIDKPVGGRTIVVKFPL